jgi:lipopolysaccharide export system permease protein
MRKLDRYILSEVAGPFLFGVAAFMIVLFSLDLLRNAFSMIFEKGIPAGIVLKSLLYQTPQLIPLTLPMGTLFGVLMTMARLCGDGETTAMQAGGVSFPRIVAPFLLLGLVVSLTTVVLTEFVAPPASQASRDMLAAAPSKLTTRRNYTFQLPPEGEPRLVLYAGEFDARKLTLKNVWIIERRNGRLWQWYYADSARWERTSLILQDVVNFSSDGRRTIRLGEFAYNIGQRQEDVERLEKNPNDMSMAEIRTEIRGLAEANPADPNIQRLWQEYHTHAALPWAALGFALLGAPLGLRPQRTSTGVGMGISLAVILLYFILTSLLGVVGRQAAIPPALSAWFPNMVVYAAGIGLLIDRSR